MVGASLAELIVVVAFWVLVWKALGPVQAALERQLVDVCARFMHRMIVIDVESILPEKGKHRRE